MIKFLLTISVLLASSGVMASSADRIVDESEGCFAKKSYPCALRVIKGNFKIERDEQVYVLDEGAAILLKSASEIQLLQGDLLIEKSADLKVMINPYLSAKVSGQFWLTKDGEKTEISNLQGVLDYQSDKVLKSEALPVGFGNWFSGVRSDQQMEQGILQPLVFEVFASKWARLSSGTKVEKLTQLKSFREQWKTSVEVGADLYAKVIERSMASIQERKDQAKRVERTKQQEREDLRKIYRQKNYLDQDFPL